MDGSVIESLEEIESGGPSNSISPFRNSGKSVEIQVIDLFYEAAKVMEEHFRRMVRVSLLAYDLLTPV